MKQINDLHIHTTYSDGELEPKQVLYLAKAKGAKIISITDHDSVDFYFDKEATIKAEELSLNIIPGVELFCMAGGVPVEILAYGFDINKMQQYLKQNAVNQKTIEIFRYNTFPKLFKNLGIKLELDESKINFNNNNPGVSKEIFNMVLKNNTAKKLILEESNDAFSSLNMFLRCTINNPKSKLYGFKNSKFPACENIINFVHSCGGLAFLAHPYEYIGYTKQILQQATHWGIDGIECIHFSANKSQQSYLLNYCKMNNLLVSGGSDFHTTKINSFKNKICEIGISKIKLNKILIKCATI